MQPELLELLESLRHDDPRILVLTGAGISAESGIPTFRGKDGYWTVGSTEYHPQEMATQSMFSRDPDSVWSWYLYRLGVCRAAKPNEGHKALVQLEETLGDRFILVTQNVDGLHQRAGNTDRRTLAIHGNIEKMRCAKRCSSTLFPMPKLSAKTKGSSLTEEEKALLRCPRCDAWSRPHVLWFDEYYEEELYHLESALEAARRSDLLLTVGTSGGTNLPNMIAREMIRRGAALIDINPEDNPFAARAKVARNGHWENSTSSAALPAIVQALS